MNQRNIPIKGDLYLWLIYAALSVISMIEIYSSSSSLAVGGDYMASLIRQILFVIVGIGVVYLMSNIHYKWCKLLMLALLPISLLLMLWAGFFAGAINDAGRWASIFGVSVQSSELAKLATILVLAFILARFRDKEKDVVIHNAYLLALGIVALFCLLIFLDNFSTAALLGLVSFCMMFLAGVEKKTLLKLVAAVVVVMAILIPLSIWMHNRVEEVGKEEAGLLAETRLPTMGGRILGFTENMGEPLYKQKIDDDNYQQQHACMAVARGKTGVGPGNSYERDFLPHAYADYIYAIVIEELGFIGGLLVMAFYLFMLCRVAIIARRCAPYPSLLVTGLALMIAFQAVINMGVSVDLFPVTGQPLPLVSRGGSSFLISSLYFGIMISVSRYAVLENKEETSAPREENVDSE